ncbi:MAG TPA: DnaD domain protein [Aggregatilineales bacterium]|nr:DnaD domain protein [Anaerolineales bacterium]HRE48141.1 DnaD domain protein [Aggregatilineales bacterium]
MMPSPHPFSGFTGSRTVILPASFFTDLLPHLDDPAELRFTLLCLYFLNQREGEYRYLRHRDFTENPNAMALFDGMTDFQAALTRALQRGTILAVQAALPTGLETLYFLHTERGLRAAEALRRGDWSPGVGETPITIHAQHPDIFTLYEQNIGAVTPLLAEQLREAEASYPREWLKEAVQIAVESNRRNWRYILAILKRWETDGKTPAKASDARDAEENPYLKDPYA